MILSVCLSVLFFCMWIQVDRLDLIFHLMSYPKKKNSLVPVYGTKKIKFNYVKTMDNLQRELIFHKL